METRSKSRIDELEKPGGEKGVVHPFQYPSLRNETKRNLLKRPADFYGAPQKFTDSTLSAPFATVSPPNGGTQRGCIRHISESKKICSRRRYLFLLFPLERRSKFGGGGGVKEERKEGRMEGWI